MDAHATGLWIVVAGIAVVLVGLLVYAGGLSWFGHLPGDFRFGRGNVRVYFPLVSMIVVSLVLTLIVNLLRRLL